MMSTLLEQLKKRRIALRAEAERYDASCWRITPAISTPGIHLDTLELIAKGLKSELVLIPHEKRMAVKAMLDDELSPFEQNKKPDKTGQGRHTGKRPMARPAGGRRMSASDTTTHEINVLKLTLHGKLVEYLAGFNNGRNVIPLPTSLKTTLPDPL